MGCLCRRLSRMRRTIKRNKRYKWMVTRFHDVQTWINRNPVLFRKFVFFAIILSCYLAYSCFGYLFDNGPIKSEESSVPGYMGKPVVVNMKTLTNEQREKIEQGYMQHSFNAYVSDMVSLHRPLPPPSNACLAEVYNLDLPQTSIIISFHNEALSTLLRTLNSVLDRSPSHLVKEILLIDDFSDMKHLKKPLDDYVANIPKIKLIRLEKRHGLIRARLTGIAQATAPILTFLDSHVECMEGWLQPLLDQVMQNPSTVASPMIDSIDAKTFEYKLNPGGFIGGFNWKLDFEWKDMPDRIKRNLKSDIDPIPTPTIAGGLFAINKTYFESIGLYDDGFDTWGAENMELSFKTWMCGGRLEIIPCSRVGHVFRGNTPYTWQKSVDDVIHNKIRVARVWMDDYLNEFYTVNGIEMEHFSDISERTALRARLNCHSFSWYVDNVYPELRSMEALPGSG